MKNNLSENLKKIRKDNNLSQEQLAEILGVSRQAISKWESGGAYPEMDKIIFICNKFNLNIDDLLHKDIKEIKGEEETKTKINKYIEDFLKFITDTINLFINMTFKSKIKCIFEQLIIAFILFIILIIIGNIGSYIINNILSILPQKINYYIYQIIECIYGIFSLIVSITIIVHIFKTRYLDYYYEIKNNKEDNNKEDNNNNNKISLKNNESKIIIRDPKHSEYKFINVLFKFIIGIIKFFSLWLLLFLSITLIILFALFIISFLIHKTGLFFVGILLALISSSIIDIILILIILNFIFNRKNDKKKMIYSFIISIILLGISTGFIFIGSLNFEVIENDKQQLITKKEIINMQDYTFINKENIKYVEKNIDNIEIEYNINKLCKIETRDYKENGIHIWGYCDKPTKLIKETIKNINNKKIINISNDIDNIIIYASNNNIEKIKNNYNNYQKRLKEETENRNYCESKIKEYEEEIEELKRRNNNIYE